MLPSLIHCTRCTLQYTHSVHAVYCPPAPVIQNGEVTYSEEPVSSLYSIDTFAYYTCNHGYVLNKFGKSYARCESNQQWSLSYTTYCIGRCTMS